MCLLCSEFVCKLCLQGIRNTICLLGTGGTEACGAALAAASLWWQTLDEDGVHVGQQRLPARPRRPLLCASTTVPCRRRWAADRHRMRRIPLPAILTAPAKEWFNESHWCSIRASVLPNNVHGFFPISRLSECTVRFRIFFCLFSGVLSVNAQEFGNVFKVFDCF